MLPISSETKRIFLPACKYKWDSETDHSYATWLSTLASAVYCRKSSVNIDSEPQFFYVAEKDTNKKDRLIYSLIYDIRVIGGIMFNNFYISHRKLLSSVGGETFKWKLFATDIFLLACYLLDYALRVSVWKFVTCLTISKWISSQGNVFQYTLAKEIVQSIDLRFY